MNKVLLEACVPNLVSLTCPSLQIFGKTQTQNRISDQSFIKENCHNSITSDYIDMKLGSVTKRDKSNKTPSKKFADVGSCDIIVIFPIYS